MDAALRKVLEDALRKLRGTNVMGQCVYCFRERGHEKQCIVGRLQKLLRK